MIRKPKTWIEREYGHRLRIYDNGGKTWDRFTVIFETLPRERDGCFQARGMSENPYHGFGQWCAAMPGRHLGKRITADQMAMIAPMAERLLYEDLDALKGDRA